MITDTNTNINYCYMCLEQTNTIIIYDCGCYNFLHKNCAEYLKKCVICNKEITNKTTEIIAEPTENILFDFSLTMYILSKIQFEEDLTALLHYIILYKSYLGLLLYVIISTSLFVSMLILLLLNFIINICRVSINKFANIIKIIII